MRVHRALARAGVASRRAAEALVSTGRVSVNGAPARIGQLVDPARDIITVDGVPVGAPAEVFWLVLHKPAGVVTTRRDPAGRRTVFDLVPDRPGLTYVGRLDYLTEGVLLLTTDGKAAHALTHPSREIERTYVATVRGDVERAAEMLLAGIELDDGPARALRVRMRPGAVRRVHELEVTIAEGRHREVRRMCAAAGLEVERLVRTQFGPVQLGALPPGASRPLTARERTLIAALVRHDHGRHRTG